MTMLAADPPDRKPDTGPSVPGFPHTFQQSCAAGFTRGCGQLGESYLFGEGVPKDTLKAKQILESACDAGYAPGCFNVGIMHRQGIATPQNASLAQARFRQGCDLGDQKACKALEQTPPLVK